MNPPGPAAVPSPQGPATRQEDDEAPLSTEQSGVWYLQQLTPDCGAYHLLFSVEVELLGPGLPGRAAEELARLTASHDILRTALPATARGPVQRVLAQVQPDLRTVDAEGWPDDELRERARLDSREPFDLSRAPPWRVQLYRRSPERWLVVAVAHHVLLDFWSLGLLLQEFAGHLGISAAPALRPDGTAYQAHARRQQARVNDPGRAGSWLVHWHSQLHGAPPVHGLPLDAPRAAVQLHDGRTLPFAFDAYASESIRRVAREQGVTPFMVLLSAYSVMLQHFSGDDDLVVATPVAGRNERAQRHQLGQFVNTVALRVRPDDRMGFGELLQQVRETVVGALRHGDCPFQWLVQEMAPRRDPAHAPIAQLGFSWERLPLLAEFERYFLAAPPPGVHEIPEARLRPFAVPQQEGQFELMLEMGGEVHGAFVGAFKYQPHLFRRETVSTMAECFVHLATLLAEHPSTPLSQIGLDQAPPAVRARASGRGPDIRWAQDGVLDMLAAQAARAPRAVAVRDRTGQALDRAALWHRAAGIATGLVQLGVSPGDRVGLMLNRHADLVAGVLGTWLAGAAYVPLDPDFPAARLAHVAGDAGLGAVFSERSLQALWPQGVPVLCRDDPLPEPAQDLPGPSDTAYVIYTSGSTGQPKGVQVGHASVRNFLRAMRELLGWDHTARLVAVTTPAFDISVLEMLLPLIVGGEVRIADGTTIRDGRLLARWLDDAPDGLPVTAMQATPATWRMLVDAGWAGTPGLCALCGGEPLPQPLAEQLHARAASLWNLYGPTETTVWSTAAKLSPGEPVHLGRPLANTQLHVLDEAGSALPPGLTGELWIGGDGLATGYWQHPGLTAERFRPLPTLPGAGRLYRTGDRVRWNADGHLEHHGRLDFQVKLRGFRIELGEIESALLAQPGIADVVVVVREDPPADARLVAYLVAAAEPPPPVDVLREALRSRLPAYMLPAAFVFLAALPQTPNRKVDRKALPVPPAPSADGAFTAPRDAVEIQLAGLFSGLLGVERVGIDDGFFDLGGHSLLAVRLVAAIQQSFKVELAVAELMQHGSVAALAQRLRRSGGEAPGMLVPLREAPGQQPLWLFHPIGGNVFCYLELTRRLAGPRPVLAFQSPGLAQAGEAEVSVDTTARRCLALLRERQPHGPYLLGGWCFGGVVAFEVARQLEEAGEAVDGIVLVDTRAPVPANVPSDADDATLLSWFARDLALPYGRVLSIEPESLRALPPEDMFEHVLVQAKALEVLAPDADAGQLGRYFEVYLANGMALQGHFPPPGPWPLLLLRAEDEPMNHGPLLGWDLLATDTLEVHDLPGDHTTIMHAPHATAVAACIDRRFPPKALAGSSP
jgi:amino acid adenylation domain-containing protein